MPEQPMQGETEPDSPKPVHHETARSSDCVASRKTARSTGPRAVSRPRPLCKGRNP